MTNAIKHPLSFFSSRFETFVFFSIFIHSCLLWQLGPALSTGSSFSKLLGQKGGALDVREVSYFPKWGVKSRKNYPSDTRNLEVTEKQQAVSSSSEKSESSGTAARGIGQGGTSTTYASILHAYLDSAKVFPRSLKELGLSGVVRVKFHVTHEGKLHQIAVIKSDAPALIEAEALRFLNTLDSVPIPPAHLTQKNLEFELPLRYELNA